MASSTKRVSLALFVLLFTSATVQSEPLRLNHIQVIGTHNSYHVAPQEWVMETLQGVTREADGWNYTHAPLDTQLERDVYNFELDLHPFEEAFEVMHVPIVDAGSTCPLFVDCLQTVYEWSTRNPKHIPISFLLEFKIREATLDGRPLKDLNEATLLLLEQEILSVFPRERIITPDDVRGDSPTLTQAVQERGWPLLAESLGRVFFVIHNRSGLRAAYTETRPSLEGRLMFVNSATDRDDCAFIVVDNPYSERIPDYLQKGIMIRVRADSGLRQGRSGDVSRRDAAFACGAQIISTDFPTGEAHPDTGYVVKFPGAQPVRCNPRYSPTDCEEQLKRILSGKQ
ncbi:MAG TPA: hypothetical protein ENN29_10975 [Candidatus Hydrogenedentes bacterium]|nr:hypothetical protein [Candidatus Hydrogenedentota bacterium]